VLLNKGVSEIVSSGSEHWIVDGCETFRKTGSSERGNVGGSKMGRIPPHPRCFVRVASKGVAGSGTWNCVPRMKIRELRGSLRPLHGPAGQAGVG